MDRKKIIIISVAILFVLIVAIAFRLFIASKNASKNSTDVPSSDSSIGQTGNVSSNGEFSSSGPSNVNAPASNLHPSTQGSMPNPYLSSLILNNPYSQTQTTQDFQKFVTSPASANQLTQVVDNKDKIVPLDQFSAAMNIKINSTLNSFLNQYDYQLVRCSDYPNSYGIMFNLGLFPDRPNIYQETVANMKTWESTLFQDTYSAVFPNANFTTSEVANQKLAFKDGQYRYAEVKLPNGTTGSINYSIIFDSITITNSPKCLAEVSAKVETLEP